jgi:DNA mismatch endonuclease (patch repair protein)|nr:very short patch repair endonuclease [Neorhizobium tomejilense]
MADTVTPEVRSRMMAAVRSRDTKPEIAIRKALHAMGFRFRVHARIGKARPDLKLTRYRAVVFVHGCFWHGHDDCRLSRAPKSNVGFWSGKIEGNMARDARNLEELAQGGWRIAVIWECAVRDLGAEAVTGQLAVWLTKTGVVTFELRSHRHASGSVDPPSITT